MFDGSNRIDSSHAVRYAHGQVHPLLLFVLDERCHPPVSPLGLLCTESTKHFCSIVYGVAPNVARRGGGHFFGITIRGGRCDRDLDKPGHTPG